MYKAGLIIIGVIWVGCDSTHKLTGTDYVDIKSESAPEMPADYPAAIIEEVGWSNITTKVKENEENEEFRVWLRSSIYPGNLYQLKKGKKGVKGDGILYWKIDTTASGEGLTHLKMQKYLLGTCTEFHKVEDYGYCIPNYIDEINWGSIYNAIESQGFWQLEGGAEMGNTNAGGSTATNKDWGMYVQMRLGNYYRAYTHKNPEGYTNAALRNDVRQLSEAIKLITGKFEQNISTNTFQGITDGQKFILCDSSEVWQFQGELNRLLARAGLKTIVSTESENTLYYVVVKGRVTPVWYYEWATGEFDRKFTVNEIYDIRGVREIKCPEALTGY